MCTMRQTILLRGLNIINEKQRPNSILSPPQVQSNKAGMLKLGGSFQSYNNFNSDISTHISQRPSLTSTQDVAAQQQDQNKKQGVILGKPPTHEVQKKDHYIQVKKPLTNLRMSETIEASREVEEYSSQFSSQPSNYKQNPQNVQGAIPSKLVVKQPLKKV